MTSQLAISDSEFQRLRELVFRNFGINLTDAKRTLLIGRLQGLLKKYGLETFGEYYDFVSKDPKGTALSELVNKISTNFTYFYREEAHFQFLVDKLLPELVLEQKKKNTLDLRLWCAGCASGEEPYTTIMMLMEYFKENYSSWNAGILATDISENALNFAKAAVYPEDRLDKLPAHMKQKYFTKVNSDEYQIIEKVRKEVTFRRLNLMNAEYPFKKKFHAIFCRNVMIYFDNPTKQALVERYYNNLENGGYLFIGHSESLGQHSQFQYVMPAVYRRPL